MPRYIDLDALLEQIQEPMNWTDSDAELQEQLDYQSFKYLIENQPIADVVPRSEVEEMQKFKDMAYAESRSYNEELKAKLDQAKQEVAKGTVEIIQAHLNMLFVALQNEKTDATVEKLIEINSKIAILESIQLALGDVKKKYIGE